MPPESEGGVFIPTERIYELLRDSIESTNEKLTEIRTDIRAMKEQDNEVKAIALDHEKRMRVVEEKLNKLPIALVASTISAVSTVILAYMKFSGK